MSSRSGSHIPSPLIREACVTHATEAVEWQDMLSDGGEVSGDDEVEVLGSQA
jgi:hypothetical protein